MDINSDKRAALLMHSTPVQMCIGARLRGKGMEGPSRLGVAHDGYI